MGRWGRKGAFHGSSFRDKIAASRLYQVGRLSSGKSSKHEPILGIIGASALLEIRLQAPLESVSDVRRTFGCTMLMHIANAPLTGNRASKSRKVCKLILSAFPRLQSSRQIQPAIAGTLKWAGNILCPVGVPVDCADTAQTSAPDRRDRQKESVYNMLPILVENPSGGTASCRCIVAAVLFVGAGPCFRLLPDAKRLCASGNPSGSVA